MTHISTWAHNGEWDKVRESGKRRLEANGYIDLGVGSYWRWMYKDWFEKAKERGVIRQNARGLWAPVGQFEEIEKVVGRRGMDEITKKVVQFNSQAFDSFCQEYQAFLDRKEATQYQLGHIINDDLKRKLSVSLG